MEEKEIIKETEGKEPEVKKDKKKRETKVEAALKAELAECKEKLLRTAAEYDNYRKRTAKEKEQLRASVVSDTVADFIKVIDNLGYAKESLSKQEGVDVSGIEMVIRQFYEIMEANGVKEIEAEGAEFDPNFHNAVMHVEDEAYGENVVVEVLQKGYIIGERVIRHAMVKVAN